MSFLKTKDVQNGEPVKIFYNDCGEGQPIVLIHGWPLSSDMWEYQINSLTENGFRVIAYDRRGFGKSSRPWNGYDYDTLTDDLNELLEQLDLQDVTLVGFSMGGGEVARYFSRYGGSRVTRAVLVSSVTPFLLQTVDNPDGVKKSVFDTIAKKIKNDRVDFLDGFGKEFFGVNLVSKPISSPLLEYFRMLASMASPRATQECAVAFSTTDFRPDMRAINVPTLIIHGTDDKTVPIEPSSEQSTKMIRDNRFIRYDGAPHGLFITEKDRLNNDLLAFIQETVHSHV